ncbi:MAG: DNA polymerase III subunit delta [bacterium]|nr:DNA polymerase III subunit delta [bacterium]
MLNIYLIVSNDKVTVDIKIKEIQSQNQEATTIQYDLEEIAIEQLIEDLDTYNFLESKKIIVGYNATFLTSDKSIMNHNVKRLEKYLDYPNPDNILVLVASALDKRKKLVTKLLATSNVIQENICIERIVQDHFQDYQVNKSVIEYLIEYCKNDHEKILMEVEKLKLYAIDTKQITKEDINLIVRKSMDDNIFSLVDFIIKDQKKEAFEVYNELLNHGESLANIISKLANKIRLIYQVKIFLGEGKSDLEISKLLNMHTYPIKLAREASYQYSDKLLLKYLSKLAELDYNLKSGSGYPNIMFETFIAEI